MVMGVGFHPRVVVVVVPLLLHELSLWEWWRCWGGACRASKLGSGRAPASSRLSRWMQSSTRRKEKREEEEEVKVQQKEKVAATSTAFQTTTFRFCSSIFF